MCNVGVRVGVGVKMKEREVVGFGMDMYGDMAIWRYGESMDR